MGLKQPELVGYVPACCSGSGLDELQVSAFYESLIESPKIAEGWEQAQEMHAQCASGLPQASTSGH